MSERERVRALYRDYLEKATELERNRKPGRGLFGVGAKPADAPCHEQFVSALRELLAESPGPDIGKAERGEKELTQAQIKAIAKATCVTQKSLLEAPKGGVGAAKTSTSEKQTGTAKKTSSAKTSSSKTSPTAVELTSAEKTTLNAWRKADAATQKAAPSLLKGEKADEDILTTPLSGAMDMLGGLGKK